MNEEPVTRTVVEITTIPNRLVRLEAITWSVLCRLMISKLSFERTIQLLDKFPRRETSPDVVELPVEQVFRGAGACLARSLARGQFLRRRGVSSTVLIGALGHTGVEFDAHAWLSPFDESQGHVVLHSVDR